MFEDALSMQSKFHDEATLSGPFGPLLTSPPASQMIDILLVPNVDGNTLEWGIRSPQWSLALKKFDVVLRFIDASAKSLYAHLLDKNWLEEAEKYLIKLIRNSRGWDNEQQAFTKKQALIRIGWEPAELDKIGRVICGVVFIGSPHLSKSDDDLVNQFLNVCKHDSRRSRKLHKVFTDMKKNLTELAMMFNDVSYENLGILTIREADTETTTFGWFRSVSKKRKLTVDPSTAKLSMRQETVVDLMINHTGLCHLTAAPNELNHDVATWFETIAQRSPDEVKLRVQRDLRLSTWHKDVETNINTGEPNDQILDPGTPVTPEVQSSMSNQQGSSSGGFEIVPSNDILQIPRRQPDLPCFYVEDSLKNKEFFGRQAVLRDLDSYLLPSSSKSSESTGVGNLNKCVVLIGVPGVGKSEVAAAYAFARRDRFDAVFWLQADTKKKLADGFAEIARKLKLKNYDQDAIFDAVTAAEDARGWLSNPKRVVDEAQDCIAQTDATWLLILDNADDPSLLADYLPILGPGSVLVTSNKPGSMWSTRTKELEPFSNEEGAELIRKWTNSHEADALASSRRITSIFGGVPLALLQCAETVKDNALSLGIFLEWHQRLQERGELIEQLETPSDRLGARGTIATRWTLQYMDAATKAVLNVFSFLDPDSIQDKICYQYPKNVAHELLLPDFPRTIRQVQNVRKELKKRPFVKFDDGEKQEWRIHRSVQDIFRFYMDEKQFRLVFTCSVALLHNLWEPEYSQGRSHAIDRWHSYNQLCDHLSSITKVATGPLREGFLSPNIQLARLLFQCSWVQKEQGRFEKASEFLQYGREICEMMQNSDEAYRILHDIFHTIGSIAMETNDPASALSNTSRVLEYWKVISEQKCVRDRNLAVGYLQHAIALLLHDRFEEAIGELLIGIEIMDAVVEDKEKISTWKLNLGYAYLLSGQLDGAEHILREGLAEREHKFGPRDVYSYKGLRSGAYHHALGNVSLERKTEEGNKDAKAFHEHAKWQFESTLGTSHHRVGDMNYILSRHARKEKKFKESESMLREALRIYALTPQLFGPEIARAKFALHLVLKQLGVEGGETERLRLESLQERARLSGIEIGKLQGSLEEDFDVLVAYFSR
ncbi:hypothetical protein DM02DRAFT_694729 [Periconia macrospinosa]|uniref:DUF7779 domain-containing protein n=1 Tax=Periconia macrospinosa TaxID=97972 RepID=A0A2V1D9Q6_9PLEO|nr:hypothetical protein DM02DRAFT_694729 [Periconia macrospinosa]